MLPSNYPVLTVNPAGVAFVAPELAPRELVFEASRAGQIFVGSIQPWLTAESAPIGNAGGLLQGIIYKITVRVNRERLQPAENRGTITMQDTSGLPVTVSVLAYVPPGVPGTSAQKVRAAAGCIPSRFFPLYTSLQPRFDLDGGPATSTEIVMIDDCEKIVDSGVTRGVLSNRNPRLHLRPLGDGRWKTSWATGSTGIVALNVLASDPANGINTMQPESPLLAMIVSAPTGPILAKEQPFETEAGVRLPALSSNMRFRIRGQNFLAPDGAGPGSDNWRPGGGRVRSECDPVSGSGRGPGECAGARDCGGVVAGVGGGRPDTVGYWVE